ncbi:BlaI/MecI/CopY family transcriptional regulator [Nocardioides sp. NPDC057767]|uniref:Putative transcriptional regulator n=1 Tax=Nocardioides albertanoniae TaxID=1175486 RepID=A0A543A3P6_9ACTN|nr:MULTISPECIES: BlaI/MecI/CopY family transcriptional regulator [Nocardioides]TQL67211.1 putative transcriptional regulator [Nocardioides albertanoniae]
MRQFGHLEAKVMDRLWSADRPLTVREVHALLPTDRQRAYTTVMTVMDKLFRKGVLERELDGKAYRYRPVASRAEHTATAMEELLSTSGTPRSTLLHFVGQLSAEEAQELREALDAVAVDPVDRSTGEGRS